RGVPGGARSPARGRSSDHGTGRAVRGSPGPGGYSCEAPADPNRGGGAPMGLFARLEAGIERAVQGTFARHLRSAVHPVEIASHIRRAMDDRAVTGSGRATGPHVFTIELSPSDFDRLAPDLA